MLGFRSPEIEGPQINTIECSVVLTMKGNAHEALALLGRSFKFQFDSSLRKFDAGDPRYAIIVGRIQVHSVRRTSLGLIDRAIE